MRDKVEEVALHTIRKFAMVEPGQTVLVALSGGADSMCLLHVLRRLCGTLGIRLYALHVDHALRPESSHQAELVRSHCAQWGIPCAVRRVDVLKRRAACGESTQDAARKLRYEALTAAAAEVGADRIAVGHTADDQAETVLMRLLRGTGLTGLAGIPPVRDGIIRPLIEVWGDQTRDYCRRHGLPVIDDPSNQSDRYLRNRVRHDLIPYIERQYNPAFRAALCRVAELARAEDEWLEAQAAQAYASAAVAGESGPGWSRVRALGLRSLPVALARRVLRYAYRKATGSFGPPLERIDAALALCGPKAQGGAKVELGGGSYAVRRGPFVELYAGNAAPEPCAVPPAGR